MIAGAVAERPLRDPYLSEDPIGFDGGVNFYSYVGNNPPKYVDPFGLDAIYINYDWYPVNTGFGFRAPLGHAGVVTVDESCGCTRYYQYGRYDREQRGVVQRRRVPDLKMGPGGRPTPESLQDLYSFLSRNYGRGSTVSPEYYDDADARAVTDYAEAVMRDPNRPPYSLLGNNCKTFARRAIAAGRR